MNSFIDRLNLFSGQVIFDLQMAVVLMRTDIGPRLEAKPLDTGQEKTGDVSRRIYQGKASARREIQVVTRVFRETSDYCLSSLEGSLHGYEQRY